MPAEDDRVDGVPAAELAALLSVPPDQFVAARTARAKELRAEGRRDDAAALAKVRKPLRLVWAVGEVARRDPDLAAEAVAGAEAAEAAMAGDGDVRVALEQYRRVTARVSATAGAVDPAVDRASLELALRQVLADPVARAAWVEGWLLHLPDGHLAPTDELAPRRARRAADRAKATADADPEAERARARDEARAARAAARAAVTEARAALEAARDRHDAVAATLAEVRARLTALEAEAADTERAVDDARRDLAAAEETARRT